MLNTFNFFLYLFKVSNNVFLSIYYSVPSTKAVKLKQEIYQTAYLANTFSIIKPMSPNSY